MKSTIHCFILLFTLSILISCNDHQKKNNTETMATQATKLQKEPISELKLQTLMKETLALAENVEVVLSRVEIPKNTDLPLHFHPGEEFAYILEGSGVLKLKGEEDIIVKAGESGMVPFKHHHSFSSLEEGTKLLVFRVHEKGQPERVLIH